MVRTNYCLLGAYTVPVVSAIVCYPTHLLFLLRWVGLFVLALTSSFSSGGCDCLFKHSPPLSPQVNGIVCLSTHLLFPLRWVVKFVSRLTSSFSSGELFSVFHDSPLLSPQVSCPVFFTTHLLFLLRWVVQVEVELEPARPVGSSFLHPGVHIHIGELDEGSEHKEQAGGHPHVYSLGMYGRHRLIANTNNRQVAIHTSIGWECMEDTGW